MLETRFDGTIASKGITQGKLLVSPLFVETYKYIAGSPEEEKKRLQIAISDAKNQLIEIIEDEDLTAAEILGFQLELLRDEGFFQSSITAMEQGVGADKAWSAALDSEIKDYSSSDNEYMAARAEDIDDLKMRVLRLIVRQVTKRLANSDISSDLIIAAASLTPSAFLELDFNKIAGIALCEGSATSHVSILARSRGVPMLVGCDNKLLSLQSGVDAILDGTIGRLIYAPKKQARIKYIARFGSQKWPFNQAQHQPDGPTFTSDGQAVKIYANVDDLSALKNASIKSFDGIGLTRTEFLFDDDGLRDEEKQYAAYKKIILWAEGLPVTIRTIDAGGDKPIQGMKIVEEVNPLLGVRGYRLSQMNENVFLTQIRALVRASIHGKLKIMIPMVTIPKEMLEFRSIVEMVVNDLKSKDIDCSVPELGMMVEVPEAALMAENFNADFYSIGSNDLTQYTTACDRNNSSLNHSTEGISSGVLKLISMVVMSAKQRNVELCICGDAASSASNIPHLLSAGVRSLSVEIGNVEIVKHAVREWDAQSYRRHQDGR